MFPGIPVKILLASGRQNVAGVMKAMKQQVDSFLLFKSFWEMQTIWVCISVFFPKIFLSPREIELGSKPHKENDHIFCFCFLESGSWTESGASDIPGEQGSCSVRSKKKSRGKELF